MKIIRISGTVMLFVLLGIAGSAYAQHEQGGEKQDHPKEPETKHEQAKPAQQQAQPRTEQNKQPQHSQQQPRPQHTQQQSKHEQAKPEQGKPAQQQAQRQTQPQQQHPRTEHAQREQRPERNQQEHAQQGRGNEQPHRTQEQLRIQHSAWDGHRSQHWDTEHRGWQQRGGYHGYRIPDERFRGYFGSDHGFRISGLPFLVVGGYPRFRYDGYWLSLVDPWPEYWGNDWYDNDDVYVAYDNGYYLFNRRYPGTGIAISISR
jgi:hypothetical protein